MVPAVSRPPEVAPTGWRRYRSRRARTPQRTLVNPGLRVPAATSTTARPCRRLRQASTCDVIAAVVPVGKGPGPLRLQERFSSAERGRADRLREKDALDILRILRILQQVEMNSLVSGFARHHAEPHPASSSEVAAEFLREHGLKARRPASAPGRRRRARRPHNGSDLRCSRGRADRCLGQRALQNGVSADLHAV